MGRYFQKYHVHPNDRFPLNRIVSTLLWFVVSKLIIIPFSELLMLRGCRELEYIPAHIWKREGTAWTDRPFITWKETLISTLCLALHSHMSMEVLQPYHSTCNRSAMEECWPNDSCLRLVRITTKELGIGLWSCYFVNTAVRCVKLTADSSLQTPSFFILALDTPCPPFIIRSSFTLPTDQSILRCFGFPYSLFFSFFFNYISSSKNLSNLKFTYISI